MQKLSNFQAKKLNQIQKTHVSSFANKVTCSTGKTSTESYQDANIGPILQLLNALNPNAKCAILVGHPKGLNRHLRRMKKLGYRDRNVVVFEWCPILARKLKKYVAKHGLKCEVIQGDLIGGVFELSQKGYHFNYIEFDSVEAFGTQEPRLYSLVSKLNIPVLVTQGSGRGQAEWFKTRAKNLGAKRYENNGSKCYKLADSANRIMAQALKGYDSHLITYGGRESVDCLGRNKAAPMYMAISIKAT